MQANPEPSREARLRALYDRLPKLACQKLCEDGCGPVPVSHLELEIVTRAAGGELPSSGTTDCPLITPDGCCSVYEDRPMVCRLWGTFYWPESVVPAGMISEDARGWRCPHGCRPERELTLPEFLELVQELESIAGPAGARSLVPEINAGLEDAERRTGGRVEHFGLDRETGTLNVTLGS